MIAIRAVSNFMKESKSFCKSILQNATDISKKQIKITMKEILPAFSP